jgi:hypothetical protein
MTNARDTESARPVPRSWDPGLDLSGRMSADVDVLEDFARELGARTEAERADGELAGVLPSRINADGVSVEKDLAKLVLSLVDLVRQLMERQAIRRVTAGTVSDDEVERMGETFLRLDRRMTELRAVFGLTRDDLALNLGVVHD